jgi:hypothetical protein
VTEVEASRRFACVGPTVAGAPDELLAATQGTSGPFATTGSVVADGSGAPVATRVALARQVKSPPFGRGAARLGAAVPRRTSSAAAAITLLVLMLFLQVPIDPFIGIRPQFLSFVLMLPSKWILRSLRQLRPQNAHSLAREHPR